MILIPFDGASGPLFDVANSALSDELFVTVVPPADLSATGDAVAARIGSVAQAWAERYAPGRPLLLAADSTTFRIGVFGLEQARTAIHSLLEDLRKSDIDIQTAIILRREVDEDGDPGPALDDPRNNSSDVEDEAEFWERSFDFGQPPPPIEDPAGMFSILQMEEGLIMELRPPLFIPDVRVCYGLTDVEDQPADQRAEAVAKALGASLHTYFAGHPPRFFNREAELGKIDRIERGSRSGYSCAVEREDLLASMVDRFRYCEHELLMAFRQVVKEMALAPVIHWMRDSVYIMNLWEN
jgi:hypothetical protein